MVIRSLFTISFAWLACTVSASAQAPANDECANASAVLVGTTVFDQTGATDSLDSIAGATCGITTIFQDVWFTFTPPTTDTYDFESFNNGAGNTDTKFALYSVTTCPADELNLIDCDDDGGATAFHSKVSASLTAGATVLLRVGTFSATSVTLSTDLVISVQPPPPPAPANDDCVNAATVALGLTSFDSTSATDGIGFALDPLVCSFGFPDEQVYQDVWFTFTPVATDLYDIASVNNGNATFDSRIAVYNQPGCPDNPANVIACDDDSGPGLEASVSTVSLTGGATYLIRVGSFSATTLEQPAALSIGVSPPPPLNPANGNHYLGVSAPGITWADAKLAAEALTFMGVQGHLATITDQTENDFIYGALGGVNNYWVGGFQDLLDPMYSEPAGGWKWITGEPFVYTNWLTNEPNNTGGFPSEDFLELLDSFALGQTWNDAHPMEHPAGYVVEFPVGTGSSTDICNGDGGNQMGCTNCPCSNNAPAGTPGGCVNSSGGGALLGSSGSTSVSLPSGDTTDLRFGISGAPANAFCILNSGDALAPGNMANPCFGLGSGAQAAAFDGLRCAITNTRRHGGRSADMNGDVGVTNNPWGGEGGPPVGIAVAGGGFVSGQTRYFQVINRDDPLAVCMRGLNTSQAREITFTP